MATTAAPMATLRRVNTVQSFMPPSPNWPAGLKCLLLEDAASADANDGASCSAQLRQCAYDVTLASSSAEALELLQAKGHHFDVLLADAHTLTGKTAEAHKLREHVKELPTITVWSATPTPEQVMQSIKLGVAEVLQKPLCPLKLKNIWQHTVRRLMRTASQQQMARSKGSLRRTSEDVCNSQNDSSIAPEPTFSPVTPVATNKNSSNSQNDDVAATEHMVAVGSPLAVAAPTFDLHCAAGDLTTATSALLKPQEPSVNVQDSALYAPPPSTPAPGAGLMRVASNSGTTTTTADEAFPSTSAGNEHASGSSNRVSGSKRKSKEISRGAGGLPGTQEEAEENEQGLQGPPTRRCSLDAPVRAAAAVVDVQPALQLPAATPNAPPALPAAAAINLSSPPSSWPLGPAAHMAIGPVAGLPAGMTWGMPLNPNAVAPGITPPIFPAPACPVMPHPLAPPAWPTTPGVPPQPTPGMLHPSMMAQGMFNMMSMGMCGVGAPFMPPASFNPMCMPGFGTMPNPMMAGHMGGYMGQSPATGGPQLPALPMSMLMGACGSGVPPPAATAGSLDPASAAAAYGCYTPSPAACVPGLGPNTPAPMAHHHNHHAAMMAGASACTPSMMNNSHLSEHDILNLGLEEFGPALGGNVCGDAVNNDCQQGARGQHLAAAAGNGGKMHRIESHQLLPSLLEDLIADGDMDMELEALSLTADLAHGGTLVPPQPPGACNQGGVLMQRGMPQQLMMMKRNDSLDDLIGQSVVAF